MAYNSKVALNPRELEDIKNIIKYIPSEFQEFYNNIFQWPTANAAQSDDEED